MTDKYYRITDDQWEVIREYLPVQRKRRHDLREIFNAILWITRTGSQWRNLDSSFPHWRAVYYYFDQWSKKGLIGQINQALNELARIQVAKAAHPSLLLIDSQSVKLAPMIYEYRGVDGNKLINGRKRQILTDTQGHIWAAKVHPANQHEGPAGISLLEELEDFRERLEKIIGDRAYGGKFAMACKAKNIQFEIPKWPRNQKGFILEKKRWVVARSFAWLNFYRRLNKDYEHTPRSAVNFILLANISMIIANYTLF